MAAVHGGHSFRFQVQSFKLERGKERGVGSLSYAKGGEDDDEHAPAPLAGIPKGWPKE
jgi:hypothetical protein